MKRLVFLISLLAALSVQALDNHVIDSLKVALREAKTPADSLPIALDLFDADNRAACKKWAEVTYDLARRQGDVTLQLEMLRNIAYLNVSNDSIIDRCLELIEELPPSADRDQSALYVRVRKITKATSGASVAENEDLIREHMRRAEAHEGKDLMIRILNNFALCSALNYVSQGDLLIKYMEELGVLLDHIPNEIDAIKSLYLNQLAINYTDNNFKRPAIEADRRLLKHIDNIEAKQRAAGRKFMNLDYYRFISLRRILSNYEALSLDEVDRYFAEIGRVSQTYPSTKHDFEVLKYSGSYYYMAHGEYEKALPLLKNLVFNNPKLSVVQRRRLISMLIKASTECGDDKTRVAALEEYNNLLLELFEQRSAERWRELQIIYDVNTLKLERAEANELLQKQTIANHQRIILGSIILVLLLLVFLFFTIRLWRRAKRLYVKAEASNATLTEERDTLKRTQRDLKRAIEAARSAQQQKEDFINNVGHEISNPVSAITEYSQLIVDCIDDVKYRYLDRFARVVITNGELLRALVSDVLTVASYDRAGLKISMLPVSVGEIAAMAEDSIKKRLNPNIELINNIPADSNILITTDVKRAMQVLINLLANANKFTHEGSITIDGTLSKDGNSYKFSITDTGCGIPQGKEEEIFERFVKLDSHSQGLGLGLSIARIVASALGGNVMVDTTYKSQGSRFVFTLPLKAKDVNN